MKLNPKAAGYQQRASDPSASAWVSANAGSGKTRVLVDRVIRLLLAGSAPSRLLCLTFTKAAAAEMALRIAQRLSEWVWLDDGALRTELSNIGVKQADAETLRAARRLFARVQETPGGLKIQTIHAFCERLLQLFPVEAGVAPQFTVMEDRTAAAALQVARDATFMFAAGNPDSEIGQALRHLSQRVQADSLDELLKKMLSPRGPAHDLLQSPQALAAGLGVLRAVLGLRDGESRESIRAAFPVDVGAYHRAVTVFAASGKTDQNLAGSIAAALRNQPCSLLDFSALYLTSAKEQRRVEKLPARDAHAANDWLRPFLMAEQQRFLEAAKALGSFARYEATAALLQVALAVRAAYEAHKRAHGHYDFDDLIARTRTLLRDRPDAAWVLYKLDGGIEHVLLDEAQDTSPDQWKVVEALTEEFFAGLGRAPETRTLFAVGDRKQSIFSFQGADPDVFLDMRTLYQQRITDAERAFNNVNFTVSFRSVPEILKAVDTVFAAGRPARAGLDGKDAVNLLHESNRPDEHGLVEIWDLETPDDTAPPHPWTAPVDRPDSHAPSRKLARRIAVTIKSWIGRRRIAGKNRLVTPGDILILVRKRSQLFSQMISALRLAGVPVAGADRLRLGDNIAVQDMLALASFAILPQDDYSLACVLKSPLLARPFTEKELFDLANPRGNKCLWQALCDDAQPVSQAAHALLLPLVIDAAGARPFDFFARALQVSRARFIARLGSEADDALHAFLQSALDYEADRAPSLAGFLAWFQAGETEIKRNMEQAAGEVRIMTVHGAKGLEAPIVILPDTASDPVSQHGPQVLALRGGGNQPAVPLWAIAVDVDAPAVTDAKARQQAAQGDEHRRLLYVAMTRAEDELYVCGYAGKQKRDPECWYDLVRTALEHSEETALVPVEPGVQRYGATPQWEDARDATPAAPLALPAWIETTADEPRAAPRVATVTGLAGEEDHSRSEGPSRGLVMHRLLQVLCETDASQHDALARQIVARAGMPETLADEALALVNDPACAAVFAAEGVSEVMLSGRLAGDGLAVSGRIDRLIVTPDSVTIVDFKTDRRLPESPETAPLAYLRQLALYAALLAEAYPERAVKAAILWTNGPEIMSLPDELLASALRGLHASRP